MIDDGDQRGDSSSESRNSGITLVFVNPHSGRGHSTKIFQKELLPLLRSNQIKFQLVLTDKTNSIESFIKSYSEEDINNIRSILIVSGDGLLHHTINAMMKHYASKQAIQVPIGVIPTGSGNGLAYTLLRQNYKDLNNSKEVVRIFCAAALQDRHCKSDLVKLMYGEKTTVWSFLSIGWGLLADIDVDSEWLRPLGGLRFTIYGLLRTITSVPYRGRLSYKISNSITDMKFIDKLKDECNASPGTYNEAAYASRHPQDYNDWIHIEDKFLCLYAVYQAYISSDTKFAPNSKLSDHLIYLTYIRGNQSPHKVLKFLLSMDDGSHESLPYVRVVPVTAFEFQPLEQSKVVVDGEVISWDQTQGPLTACVASESMKLLWP